MGIANGFTYAGRQSTTRRVAFGRRKKMKLRKTIETERMDWLFNKAIELTRADSQTTYTKDEVIEVIRIIKNKYQKMALEARGLER